MRLLSHRFRHRSWSKAVALSGCVAVVCAAACSGSGADAPSGGACTATIDSIESTIFVPRCAIEGCHTGPTAQGDLDLGGANLEARLVGAAATQCGGQTIQRSTIRADTPRRHGAGADG